MNKECLINFDVDEFKSLSKACIDLLVSMCQKDPKKRPNAIKALTHMWFSEDTKETSEEFAKKHRSNLFNYTNKLNFYLMFIFKNCNRFITN